VLFSWAAETSAAPAEVSVRPLIEVRGSGGAYEAWSEHEIRVRVCDGAASGIVQVLTPRGKSNAAPFVISEKPGSKTIWGKRTYSIAYSVNVRVENAAPPNNMYLWLPVPPSAASQLNKERLSDSAKPFIEDYRGVSLYRLTGLQSGDDRQVSVSYLVDVYNVETEVRPGLVKPYFDSPEQKIWTQPSAFVPSDDKAIKETALKLSAGMDNPYLKANAIYQWFTDEFTVSAENTPASLRQTLGDKKAGPYEAAMLFCALCRAAGIPAIPVAGVLCPKAGVAIPHYWVEFWIDGLGWVPVDPALGAGAVPGVPAGEAGEFSPASREGREEFFKPRGEHKTYYFGNIDNQHLSFSRGETSISQIDPGGRTAGREAAYALQNIWEEASSGIEAYSTHWSDINITGIYLN
jgi:transglutaminase-like putative cysteine protease